MPGIKLPQIIPGGVYSDSSDVSTPTKGICPIPKAPRSSPLENKPYDLPEAPHLQVCHQHGYDLKLSLWRNRRTQVCFAKILDTKMQEDPRIMRYVVELGHGYCAVKIIDKSKIGGKKDLRLLQREMLVHQQLSGHPYIVRFIDHFQCPSNYYIVLEFCSNGDLVDHINRASRWTGHGLPEHKARLLFIQLLEAIKYCHNKGIAHRDIKLENILLDEHCQVKLADFGFARSFKEGPRPRTPCGSRPYAAPELLFGKSESYDAKATDIWSMGVILHAMVTGRLPFDVNMDALYLRDDMHRQRLQFLDSVSKEAESLIRGMLQYSPGRRLSLLNVFQAPWICHENKRPSRRSSNPLLTDHPSETAMRNYAMRTFSTIPVGPGVERIQLKSRGGRSEVHAAWERSAFRTTRYSLGEDTEQRKKCRAAAQQARNAVHQARQLSQRGFMDRPRAVTAGAAIPFSGRESVISPSGQRMSFATKAKPKRLQMMEETGTTKSEQSIVVAEVAAANRDQKNIVFLDLTPKPLGSSTGTASATNVVSSSTKTLQPSHASVQMAATVDSTEEMSVKCVASSSSNFKPVPSQARAVTSPKKADDGAAILQPKQTTRAKHVKAKDKLKAADFGCSDVHLADQDAASLAGKVLNVSKLMLQEHSLLYLAGKEGSPQSPPNAPSGETKEVSEGGEVKLTFIPHPPPGHRPVVKDVPIGENICRRRTYAVSTLNPSDFFNPKQHEV